MLHEHQLQQQLEQLIILEEDVPDEEDVVGQQLPSVADIRKFVAVKVTN